MITTYRKWNMHIIVSFPSFYHHQPNSPPCLKDHQHIPNWGIKGMDFETDDDQMKCLFNLYPNLPIQFASIPECLFLSFPIFFLRINLLYFLVFVCFRPYKRNDFQRILILD